MVILNEAIVDVLSCATRQRSDPPLSGARFLNVAYGRKMVSVLAQLAAQALTR